MRVALASAIMLVACGRPSCPLDEAVEPIVGDAVLADCGHVISLSGDAADFAAARDCVLEHVASEQPFIASWNDCGIEGGLRRTLIGLVDGSWQTYQVDAYRTAEEEEPPYPYSVSSRCDALAEIGGCSPGCGTICVVCVEPVRIASCGDVP